LIAVLRDESSAGHAAKREHLRFYIGGAWVDPVAPRSIAVINPATEAPVGRVSMGSAEDVDRAVTAARAAFPSYSRSSIEERVALFERIAAEYARRYDEIVEAITDEMGAPTALARDAHAAGVTNHLKFTLKAMKEFAFRELRGATLLVREPIGVCALITPWNFPVTPIALKVLPALAAGCTVVLKPSEISPFSAQLFAEALHAAGVPRGVFNLVNGDGPTVGAALARHPQVDMVSITGSVRAGIEVAVNAAPTVKRVHQELGGKSPNIILEDADFRTAVTNGVKVMMRNSGQVCNAPSRLLVPRSRMAEALAIAREAAESIIVGDPRTPGVTMGPLASAAHWEKVQGMISKGLQEGATLVTGGLGRPVGLECGGYAKPTILACANNRMTVAREEIFGPVLTVLGYDTVDEAVEMANDTPYGLAAYVSGTDPDTTRDVASRLRAGQVYINSPAFDLAAPFGGYKQSGNGREWGAFGLAEFLEVKALVGFGATR
jgi:aldehyde dehydrogenase (NAD+)